MQVSIEITLPAAPAQAAQHVKRVVTITVGGASRPSLEVEPGITVLPAFAADIGSTVQVSVADHLANGKSAVCQSPVVNPADHVEAVAADPAGFAFKVTPIVEGTQAVASTVVSAVASEPAQSQIDPATGRVIANV